MVLNLRSSHREVAPDRQTLQIINLISLGAGSVKNIYFLSGETGPYINLVSGTQEREEDTVNCVQTVQCGVCAVCGVCTVCRVCTVC